MVKTLKKYMVCFLVFAFVLQSSGLNGFTCEAANGYFVSGKCYFHKIARNKVEVCGIRAGKVKGTFDIPEKVSYKGKQYTVTRIADMEYVDQSLFYPADAHKESLDWPGNHYYLYFHPSGAGIMRGDVRDIPGSGIKKVVLPKTITYIGEGAFNGCDKLTKVEFAKKYKKLVIGKHAFSGKSLKNLVFPEGTTEIRDFAAGETPNITIPSSVKKIGAGVVNNHTKKVKISRKNKKFKMKAGILYTYNEQTLLGASAKVGTSVRISSKTTKLMDQAFCDSRITDVDLGGSVKEIPKGAFARCSSLRQVTGSGQVAKIGYGAFYDCIRLTDLGDVSGVEEIKDDAFVNAAMLTLPVSSKMRLADEALSGAADITRIHVAVPENDPVYSIENGLLLRKEENGKTVLLQTEDMERVDVPEGVTRLAVAIGDKKLCREVILPESLKRQESWIYINEGTITYKAQEIPEFCRHFFIQNSKRDYGDKKTKIFVPKNALEEYKKKMQEAAQESESEWLDLRDFFESCGLELQGF